MKILLTGATGLVGKALSLRLARSGHSVIGVARRKPQWWPDNADFVSHDFMADPIEEVVGIIDKVGVIIHGCDLAKVDLARNHLLAKQLLERSVEASCPRFIYLSSIRVYGAAFGRVDERMIAVPVDQDSYGKAKLQIENMIANRVRDFLETVILRLGNVFSDSTPQKIPRQQALLTRLLYKGMNHHLISAEAVAESLHHFVTIGLMNRSEVLNITQEIDKENDYFYLASILNGQECSLPDGAFGLSSRIRKRLSDYRGEGAAAYFCRIEERRLTEYGLKHSEPLVDALCRIKGY